MKLTIWSELAQGGMADYAHVQATALAAQGVDVEMLCPPRFTAGRSFTYCVKPLLRDLRPANAGATRLVRAMRIVRGLLTNAKIVAHEVARRHPDAVLTHFSEYLAPLWAWRMRRLKRRGVRFLSVLHDPVRDHVVGPGWWHALSVREAWSFLDVALVHTHDRLPVPKPVKVVWVPHGPYPFPPPRRSRAEVRRELGIPQSAIVLIAFGYIRDNKNLDLAIQAISDLPQVHLIVAGSEQAGGNKPVSAYQRLAAEAGCSDRCRWLTRFIDEEEAADLVSASDLSLLAYSRSFKSASGALAVTAHYKVPCLISNGSLSNRDEIERYMLGVWVDPDSASAIARGLRRWLTQPSTPDWEGYARDHSWTRNAEIVTAVVLSPQRSSASIDGKNL